MLPMLLHIPTWLGISAFVWALFVLVVLVVVFVGLVFLIRGPAALKGLLSPGVRVQLYDVASLLLMLAAGYGLVDGNLASLWNVALAGVLRVARANVPAAPDAKGQTTAPDPAAIAQAIAQALAQYFPAAITPPVLTSNMATTPAAPVTPDPSSTPVAPTGA